MVVKLWNESKALTATTAFMLLDFVFSLLALTVDPRIITGMPAWLKPAKFGISSAIFAASIAWLFRYMPDFAKYKSWVGSALSVILVVEIAIIDFQAARGRVSHFNVSTPEDATLYGIMGSLIGVLWVLTIWITVALFRQKFADRAWGWALRLAMLMSVLGSASGGLMTMPSSSTTRAIAAHERPVTMVGAHTVGAPDGGPGMAGVGWSTQHGDLRIAHFIGLHGLQVIPLIVWWLRRKRSTRQVFAIFGSYLALYLILSWQALRGESLVEPGALTLSVWGVWLIATAGTLITLQRNGYGMEVLHES